MGFPRAKRMPGTMLYPPVEQPCRSRVLIHLRLVTWGGILKLIDMVHHSLGKTTFLPVGLWSTPSIRRVLGPSPVCVASILVVK